MALAERFVRKMRNLTDLVADAFILNADSSDPFLILNEITVQPNQPDRVDARAERVQVLAAALEDPVLAKHVAVMMQSTAIGLASIDLSKDLMPDLTAWNDLMNIVVLALRA